MNYIKGWILTGVDTLSRAPLKSEKSETDNAERNSYVHLTKSTFLISGFRLQQFEDETKSDENLRKLCKSDETLLPHIQNRWLKLKNDVPNLIRRYTDKI